MMTDYTPGSGLLAERLAAHAWAADLVGQPWPERLRRVREDRCFASPSFIELSISLGQDFGLSAADRQRWALLAVEAAMRGRCRRAEDLEPLAWAVLGAVYRIRGRLAASHAAFTRCQALRYRICDLLELAETYSLESSYWWDIAGWSLRRGLDCNFHVDGRADLARAAELIDEALRLATPYAPEAVIGLYEIKAGNVANIAERWSVAMTMRLAALDRIDPAASPRLALQAAHNLAETAIFCGQLDVALSAIARLEGSYAAVGFPKLSLQRDWLFAHISRAQGRAVDAERLLHGIRHGFTAHGMLYEAADIDLELAQLAAERGRWPAAHELAARATRTLIAAGAPHVARVASRMFRG